MYTVYVAKDRQTYYVNSRHSLSNKDKRNPAIVSGQVWSKQDIRANIGAVDGVHEEELAVYHHPVVRDGFTQRFEVHRRRHVARQRLGACIGVSLFPLLVVQPVDIGPPTV